MTREPLSEFCGHMGLKLAESFCRRIVLVGDGVECMLGNEA